MKSLRRLSGVVALAALAAGGLAACSNGTTAAGGGAHTLTMLISTDDRAGLGAVITKFEKQNPGNKIDVTYSDPTAIQNVLPTELSSGTAPDVFTTQPGSYSQTTVGQLGKQGYLLDLSGQPWAKTMPAAYRVSVGYGGKIYQPALTTISIVTMYNQTALDKNGLTIPQTWSQVLALCAAAKAKGITAYSLGAQTDFENQMLPFLFIGTLVDRVYPQFNTERAEGKVTFTNSPWKTAFENELTMFRQGCFTDPDGTSINAAEAAVAQGKSLGMFGLSVQVSDLQALAKGQRITVTTLPATNNPADTRMPVALGASLSVNAKSKNVALAEKFLDFIQRPAVLSAFAVATGQVPAVADHYFTPGTATAEQVKYQAGGRATPVDDQFFPNPNVRLDWISENEKMLAGQATPADITEAMDAAYGKK